MRLSFLWAAIFFFGSMSSFAKIRVVALSPGLCEWVGEFQNQNPEIELVGRIAYCDFPAGIQKIPSVGDAMNISQEGIIALKPDWILSAHFSQHAFALKQLETRGYAVLDLDYEGLENYFSSVQILAKTFKLPTPPLRQSFLEIKDLVRARLENKKIRPPLILSSLSPLYAFSGKSLLTEALADLGITPALYDHARAMVTLSREGLLSLKPEQIVLISGSDANAQSMEVLSRKLCTVYSDGLQRPGSRFVAELKSAVQKCLL